VKLSVFNSSSIACGSLKDILRTVFSKESFRKSLLIPTSNARKRLEKQARSKGLGLLDLSAFDPVSVDDGNSIKSVQIRPIIGSQRKLKVKTDLFSDIGLFSTVSKKKK